MRAKVLINALVRSGRLSGSIHTGSSIRQILIKIESGKILPRKEYFYTFRQVGYIEPDVVAITNANERVFMYQL